MHVARGSTTAGRLTRSLPLGHLIPGLLVLVGIVVGIYFGISSLLSETQTISPEHSLVQPMEASSPPLVQDAPIPPSIQEVNPPTDASPPEQNVMEKEPVEVNPFATSFPMLDVEWEEVKDLDSIPLEGEGSCRGWSMESSDEAAEWTARLFPAFNESQFAAMHPVSLSRYCDNEVVVAFLFISVMEIVGNEVRAVQHYTWLLLSQDGENSWVQFGYYPRSSDESFLSLIGQVRTVDTGDSIKVFVKPDGFEPWMKTTVKKPLG